jgi:type I restriction enzyme S subunit
VPIGDVCEVNPRFDKSAVDMTMHISFIPMAAVGEETGSIDALDHRSVQDLAGKSYRGFLEGDVLVAKITPSMENGKGAVARGLAGGIGMGSTEFHVLRPTKSIDAEYLLRFVLQPSFRREARMHMTGTAGQLRVPASFLAKSKIPLPPITEQRRIVDAIEEKFSRIDAGEKALRSCSIRIPLLHRTVIAASLLNRKWPIARWGEVGKTLSGKAFPSGKYSTSGVHLLRPGNLDASGEVIWSSKATRWLPESFADSNSKYLLQGRHLLMNLTAQSLADDFLGRVCLSSPSDRFLLNQRIAMIESNDASNEYLHWVFRSQLFRSFVANLNSGSLIQHISTKQLDAFEFPLPPPDDQDQIVSELEERIDLIDACEAELAMNERHGPALRRTILSQAFLGKLVPQDHEDEPANALQEHIHAERGSSTARKVTTKKVMA